MSKLHLYTDGACKGNPGSGGAAFVVVDAEKDEIITQYMESSKETTTNNAMEMLAFASALAFVRLNQEELKEFTEITVFTDSALISNCLKDKWYVNWERNGWKNSAKVPVKNKELWKAILDGYRALNPTVTWVKGHAGNKYNEVVDTLASNAAAARRKIVEG